MNRTALAWRQMPKNPCKRSLRWICLDSARLPQRPAALDQDQLAGDVCALVETRIAIFVSEGCACLLFFVLTERCKCPFT